MSEVPKPGRPVRGSHTGRPIMVLLDLLGRRWALRILWELRDGTPQGFRELQRACGNPSPTVVSQRLNELTEAGILEKDTAGYGLSGRGRDLLDALLPLDVWARNWARDGAWTQDDEAVND